MFAGCVDADCLLAQLNRGATMAVEHEIVARLQGYLDDQVPTERRKSNFWSAIREMSELILSLPWRDQLDASAMAAIRLASDGANGFTDVILGLLCVGGINASSIAFGGGLWVPWWLIEEASRRTGYDCRGIETRVVIPGGWPCPTRQGLVMGFRSQASLERIIRLLPMRPAIPTGGMFYPDEWLFPGQIIDSALLIQDLRAIGRGDSLSAFQAGVSQYGNPMIFIAFLLANSALDIAMRYRRAWSGIFPTVGCQVARSTKGEFYAGPGWLPTALLELGMSHPGIRSNDAFGVEIELIKVFGGRTEGQVNVFPMVMQKIMEKSSVTWPHLQE